MKGLFDRVGQTPFLEKFSTQNYGSYAFFQGTVKQDGVSIKGAIDGTQVVISPTTIVVVSEYSLDGMTMSKDQEKEITQETVDMLLYKKPRLDEGDKKVLMQSYPLKALDRRLQDNCTKDAREGPRVLMSLRVDFGPMG